MIRRALFSSLFFVASAMAVFCNATDAVDSCARQEIAGNVAGTAGRQSCSVDDYLAQMQRVGQLISLYLDGKASLNAFSDLDDNQRALLRLSLSVCIEQNKRRTGCVTDFCARWAYILTRLTEYACYGQGFLAATDAFCMMYQSSVPKFFGKRLVPFDLVQGDLNSSFACSSVSFAAGLVARLCSVVLEKFLDARRQPAENVRKAKEIRAFVFGS